MKAAGVLVALSVAVALGACGDLGGRYRALQIVRPAAVDQRALERYGPGSPERTVLEWYAALQRHDVVAASRYYALRASGATPGRLRRLMAGARPFFTRVGLGPLSADAVRPGSAMVFTDLRVRWEAPNGRAQELRSPQSFTLVREAGRWRFADTYFLSFARGYRPQRPLKSW